MWAIPVATLVAALFADNAQQPSTEGYSGAWRGSYQGRRRRRAGESYGADVPPVWIPPVSLPSSDATQARLQRERQWVNTLPVSGPVKAWLNAELDLDTIRRRWVEVGGTQARELTELLQRGAAEGDAGLLLYLDGLTRVQDLHNRAFPGSGMSRKESINQIKIQHGSPPMPASSYGYDQFGVDLVQQIKSLDDQMWKTVKQTLGWKAATLFPKLAAKQAMLKQLSAQRDDFIAQGLSPVHASVASVEQQIRHVTSSILGEDLSTKIEQAISGLKAKRDALLQQLGSAGLAAYRATFGFTTNFGAMPLSRAEMASFGAMPLSRAELASGEPVYGAGLEREAQYQRLQRYGSTRERESRYSSPTLLYGDAPCSLGASAYGLNDAYGGHPIIDEIKRLNELVLGIVKRYVKPYQVSKISQLMSINKKRDDLIKAGAPSNDSRVIALDDQARGIVNPTPADDVLVSKIAHERDGLLRKAVSEGIQV